MKKQRPDADKLANELLGASAFFRPYPRPADSGSPAPAVEPAAYPSEEASSPDVVTSRRHSVTTLPTTPLAPEPAGFDLNRPTASRDSLRLSIDETKALDALRQALKWDHDLTVSKNDICRAALHALLEDWMTKGEKSDALKRLKRKQQR